LTQQLLVFSRKQPVQTKPMDLNSVIRGAEKMLRRLIGENIELTLRLCRNLGQIEADPAQMEQLILILAVNARDAMPQGGRLTISTTPVDLKRSQPRITPTVASGRYVQLAVRDSGAGMDEETSQQIFEPFFTTKSQGRGRGLGLAMVYGIVRQSGGAISVDSAPGQGTNFRIFLRQVQPNLEAEVPDRPVGKLHCGNETILVVEDEEGVRALTKELLQRCGYHVLAAENGEQALKLAQSNGRIALLLTDVVMPGMSGRELAERFLKLNPGAKVLYMSGYTDDAVLHHGVVEQEASFLQKPFRHSQLTRKVRELLDR
ncbi:MAG: ATP-binding protein, partial [Acidobacteriota bacterium]